MNAEYSILAVVLAGQKHPGLEILKLVFDAVKAPDNRLSLVLILELFGDFDQFGYFVKLIRKFIVCIQAVLK